MSDERDPGDGAESKGADGTANDATDAEEPIEPGEHALPPEDLQYPEFVFDDGEIGAEGAFDLSKPVSPEGARALLTDLAGGIASHDVAVESPDGHVTFGVKPADVEMAFDPGDEEAAGELSVTMTFDATPMVVADDPDATKVGARGGKGFVPIEQLTTDREQFRCYNWIEDPTDP